MPKATFLNLAAEKRQTLIDIALDEFAENDYTAASISKIVERAQIAKGSLYQYFVDKQDLFIYLVEYASQHLLAELPTALAASADEDFFVNLRRQMSASVQVHLAQPRFSRLLRRALQSPTSVRQEVMRRVGASSSDYFLQLVQRGIERGDLKAGLDPIFITVMINGLLSELGNYISAVIGLDAVNMATVDVAVFDSPRVEQIFDTMLDLLRNGLANHS